MENHTTGQYARKYVRLSVSRDLDDELARLVGKNFKLMTYRNTLYEKALTDEIKRLKESKAE